MDYEPLGQDGKIGITGVELRDATFREIAATDLDGREWHVVNGDGLTFRLLLGGRTAEQVCLASIRRAPASAIRREVGRRDNAKQPLEPDERIDLIESDFDEPFDQP